MLRNGRRRAAPRRAGLVAISQQQREQVDARAQRIEIEREHTSVLLGMSGAVSLIVGALLAWLLARSFTVTLRLSGVVGAFRLNGGAPSASTE